MLFSSNRHADFRSETGSYSSNSENSAYSVPRQQETKDSLTLLTNVLYKQLRKGNIYGAAKTACALELMIGNKSMYSGISTAYPIYLVGIVNQASGDYLKSFSYFYRALDILEIYPSDSVSGKVNYNLGRSSNLIGDDVRSDLYFSKSLEYVKKTKGVEDPELVKDYISLAIANINIRNYEKSLEYTNRGLAILSSRPHEVPFLDQALLYQTKGTALNRISDLYQSAINYSAALKIYENHSLPKDEFYINLINNLGSVYYSLGEIDKSILTFDQGMKALNGSADIGAYNLASNYAKVLALTGQKTKGQDIINKAVAGVEKKYNSNSREYTLARSEFADYLREFKIDFKLSRELSKQCFEYVRNNPWDLNLRTSVSLGYALGLMADNEPLTALDSVNSILFRDAGLRSISDPLTNPDLSLLKTDDKTLDILQTKYLILKEIFSKEQDQKILISQARTAELIIEIIETIRINIGEEQSRILLGDKFRDAYLNVISSYLDCYKVSGEANFLEKAFEYTERSKAASLLASIREMKAMKAYIPSELVAAERKIQEEIGFYSGKYEAENNKEKPDSSLIEIWESSLLKATSRRDSLKNLFKTRYKGFYDLKYNTRVVGTGETKKLIGRNKDYVSYIVSDTLLYILVVNNKSTNLETVKIDSGFTRLIAGFRKLLSEPDRNENAREEFENFQKEGYRLYSLLIEPVRRHFISGNLIISPDNLLSFFPFETLITSDELHTDLYYSRLSYLMNEYRISYAYSATLLSESEKTMPAFRNSSLAFAPSYDKPIFIDSLSVNRQQTEGTLSDLVHAREEAQFVADITSGVSYLGKSATKNIFEQEAGKYDILHLAMHTVLKSMDPVNSGMIFSETDSPKTSRYLRPYEIYNIQLNAKMVILSSCYTGAGKLYAGEGVLSLARGFIFSGSKSVVMSLWEVDDREGTEIIKAFYRNLKSGKHKSEALRKARLDYLKETDMLRAHPYYWSTLVNYGDDSPLYISNFTKGILLLFVIMMFVYIASYLRKR